MVKNSVYEKRYLTIDGLRGLAAIGVAIFHFSGALKGDLESWVPSILLDIFSYGYLGVPVFFILSGFVIALSVGNANVTPGYIGNFALRRSIRLDPTYWASIVIILSLIYFRNLLSPEDQAKPYPSIESVIAHIFYLQDILGFPPSISAVYWTLCLEIQLYLFYIIVRGVNSYFLSIWPRIRFSLCNFIIIPIGLYSLLLDNNIVSMNITGTFLPYWHYFLMGVLLSYVVRKYEYGRILFIVWISIELLFLLFVSVKPFVLAGVLTVGVLFILARTVGLSYLFSSRIFQYFGRISYAFYLMHGLIVWTLISFTKNYIGEEFTPIFTAFVFLFSFLCSVVISHILHVLVEVPSLRFSSKFKKIES